MSKLNSRSRLAVQSTMAHVRHREERHRGKSMTDCVTENRRKWLRTRTLYGGTITTVGGAPIIACTIRSISSFGARVQLLSEHILPDRFILVDEKNGAGHHAKVVWRGSKLAGLWFEDSFPVDSTLPTHLEVLR